MHKVRQYGKYVMGRGRIILILCALLLITTPVHAEATAQGHKASAFRQAQKSKRIKLKKYSCSGTVLYADTAISKKRRTTMRKWILALPKKIRKKASRIYFVRKKFYMMTGTGLKGTAGYTVFPDREIWLYNVADSDDLRDTVYHEFGHCWDWNTKKHKFTLSTTQKWALVWLNWYGAEGDPCEYYAMAFAEYMGLIQDPDWNYIVKTLKGVT